MAKKRPKSAAKKVKKKRPRRSKSPTVAKRIRDERARSALKKRQAGKEPTTQELKALAEYEEEKRVEIALEFLEAMPQGMFIELTGRPAQVIYRQAETYGLPIAENPVNLKEALTAYHDLFADYGEVFRDKTTHQGKLAVLTERDKEASVRKKELEVGEIEGHLVRKTDVDRDRMELVKTVQGIIQRSPSDLAVRFMKKGVPPSVSKKILEEYWAEIVREWIKVSRERNGTPGRRRKKLSRV